MGAVASRFSKPVWAHAKVLLVGAIRATGTRTVTACWRVMGLSQAPGLVNSPRGLHRARWSLLAARHMWLRLLGPRFAPAGAVVLGLDDPRERRRGENITAHGLDCEPVRSSQAPVVKASGWRWLWGRVVAQVAWAGAMGGLPCRTGLGPAERYQAARGRRHQTWPERARQSRRRLTRWVPDRQLLCGGDSRLAVRERLPTVRQIPHAGHQTRVRMEAE
jgi:hypothetical protein